MMEQGENRRSLPPRRWVQGSLKPFPEAPTSCEEPAATPHVLSQFDSGMAFCHTSSPRQLRGCPQKLTHNSPVPLPGAKPTPSPRPSAVALLFRFCHNPLAKAPRSHPGRRGTGRWHRPSHPSHQSSAAAKVRFLLSADPRGGGRHLPRSSLHPESARSSSDGLRHPRVAVSGRTKQHHRHLLARLSRFAIQAVALLEPGQQQSLLPHCPLTPSSHQKRLVTSRRRKGGAKALGSRAGKAKMQPLTLS